jgi:carbon-monoxide dehydrogenase medium subunit
MQSFNYLAPHSQNELCQVLCNTAGKIIAGGTDMLPQMRNLKQTPSTLIDISHISDLRYIQESEDEVLIGALTTWSDILESPLIQKTAPALAQAASLVGAPMTRNRGTIGGNLGNASPAADSLPPLLTLDAIVHLNSQSGQRQVPLRNFLTGPGTTDLKADEYIQQVSYKKVALPFGNVFNKLGPRQGMTISIASVAVLLALDANGKITLARIALGAVAPTAVRCPDAEAFLLGKEPSTELWQEAAHQVRKAIAPIDDVRGTQEYRHHIAGILTRRALQTAYLSLQE